jgi:hypothetical protein
MRAGSHSRRVEEEATTSAMFTENRMRVMPEPLVRFSFGFTGSDRRSYARLISRRCRYCMVILGES